MCTWHRHRDVCGRCTDDTCRTDSVSRDVQLSRSADLEHRNLRTARNSGAIPSGALCSAETSFTKPCGTEPTGGEPINEITEHDLPGWDSREPKNEEHGVRRGWQDSEMGVCAALDPVHVGLPGDGFEFFPADDWEVASSLNLTLSPLQSPRVHTCLGRVEGFPIARRTDSMLEPGPRDPSLHSGSFPTALLTDDPLEPGARNEHVQRPEHGDACYTPDKLREATSASSKVNVDIISNVNVPQAVPETEPSGQGPRDRPAGTPIDVGQGGRLPFGVQGIAAGFRARKVSHLDIGFVPTWPSDTSVSGTEHTDLRSSWGSDYSLISAYAPEPVIVRPPRPCLMLSL